MVGVLEGKSLVDSLLGDPAAYGGRDVRQMP
jgi:hypothetical protein